MIINTFKADQRVFFCDGLLLQKFARIRKARQAGVGEVMKPLPKGKVTLEEFKVLQNFLPFFIWSLLVGDTISAEFCKTFLKFAFNKN